MAAHLTTTGSVGADHFSAQNREDLSSTLTATAMPSKSLPSGQHPLMLHVHVPFCPSKCHFCGWVQGIPKADLLLRPGHDARRAYTEAVCYEIR